MPRMGLRPRAPRPRVGKIALLALAIAAMGYVCARLIMLLADVRPYVGWYLLLAVAGGIVAAVALPWLFASGFRRSARWSGWLLLGYTAALVGGMRYYVPIRFTPSRAPTGLPPPPWWFVLEIAGLAAVAFTVVAITLLILMVLAEAIAPGPIERWLRARRTRRVVRTVPGQIQ